MAGKITAAFPSVVPLWPMDFSGLLFYEKNEFHPFVIVESHN